MSFGFMVSMFGFFLVIRSAWKMFLFSERGVGLKLEELIMMRYDMITGLFMAFGGLGLSNMIRV